MSVGTYPSPEFGGPPIALIQKLPVTFPGARSKEFKDGGASYGLSNANGLQKWLIIHQGLTTAEGTTLDNHNVSANGIYGGFTFKDPRSGITYTDVHYESYDYPQHKRITMTERRTVLVKRPI